jgi:hypothetical protein
MTTTRFELEVSIRAKTNTYAIQLPSANRKIVRHMSQHER